MAWRFRKRMKVIPGVYLNFSKKGISTTVGPKSFSVNFSSKGTYLNTSIPGTGFSNRVNLSGNTPASEEPAPASNTTELLQYLLEQTTDGTEKIESKAIDQLTSPGLANLKTTILAAHNEFAAISADLDYKNKLKAETDRRLYKNSMSIFRIFLKKRIERLTNESDLLQAETDELKQQQGLARVDLTIYNDDTFEPLYNTLEKSYQLLIKCEKIWDVTTSKIVNRAQQRSYAGTEIRRVQVCAVIEPTGLISLQQVPLKLENKNGGDLFFFPGFVIIHEQALDFAILDYSELDLEFEYVRFVESEKVPPDSTTLGHTWFKVNKDGRPDRRFSNNYQIPIAGYGQINFTSPSGLHESYLFSNQLYSRAFYDDLKNYVQAVKAANELLKEFK